MKFSIILVTYNNFEIALNAIQHIYKQSYINYELIIIDNSSKEIPDSLMCLIKNHKDTKLIKNEKNFFYAQSLNTGFKNAKGELLVFLNSDVLIGTHFLKDIDSFSKSNDKAEVFSPVIYKPDNNIDSYGIKTGLTWRPVDITKSSFCKSVFGPTGCAFIIKKNSCLKIIKQFGDLFDRDISFFYTDLSFAFRLNSLNIKTSVISKTKAVHHRAASTPYEKSILPFRFCKLSRQYKQLLIKDRKTFLKKYFTIKNNLFSYPFIITYSFVINCLINIKKK